MAAAMLFACTGHEPEDNGGDGSDDKLVLTSDKNLIQTFGGDFATLSVTLGGKPVTEDVIFFDADKNLVDVPDFKFSTETPGEHQLIASFGTYLSEPVTINAVSVEIPQTPADPEPGSTDFKAKVMVIEFTGTGCPNCPPMKTLVHTAMADEAFADKVVLLTYHSYNEADPAYYGNKDFPNSFNITGYPNVICDMYQFFSNYQKPVSEFTGIVNALYDAKEDVAAGIAVNSVLSEDGQLLVKATVKSAETASYRVGAFLVEDGIYGKQASATEEWMHTHDGVISHVDGRFTTANGKKRFYGHDLGSIAKGEAKDHMFIWNINQIEEMRSGSRKPFVRENLRVVVYVSSVGQDERGDQFYYVNNVVECPLNGQTLYLYN